MPAAARRAAQTQRQSATSPAAPPHAAGYKGAAGRDLVRKNAMEGFVNDSPQGNTGLLQLPAVQGERVRCRGQDSCVLVPFCREMAEGITSLPCCEIGCLMPNQPDTLSSRTPLIIQSARQQRYCSDTYLEGVHDGRVAGGRVVRHRPPLVHQLGQRLQGWGVRSRSAARRTLQLWMLEMQRGMPGCLPPAVAGSTFLPHRNQSAVARVKREPNNAPA